VPELPQQRMNRFVEMGVKEQDAFVLTREVKGSLEFEKQVLHFGKQFSQKIANIMINTKIEKSDVRKLSEKIQELIAPKETDFNLLEESITKVIQANQKVVDDYKSGKQNALMFLVGQVMKEMKGQADAKIVINVLKKKLG
jgi:Asp-tRNA(Asn)/Glu-tRNA(Gln) amidotransferase B subunit